MATKKIQVLQFKRRRQGRTNYKKRLQLLVSKRARIVIRRSNSNILIQIVRFSAKGDLVELSCHSSEIVKQGWKYGLGNMPAAYLTGALLGKKALAKDISKVTIDVGTRRVTKANALFAAIKGMKDSGLDIHADDKMLPDEKRVSGSHIVAHAQHLKKENPDAYNSLFSGYLKKGAQPELMQENFQEVKKKILGK